MSFKDKVALVTGAGGGMGFAIARDLMAEGARVVTIDLKPRPEAFTSAGDRLLYVDGDVSEEAVVAGAIDQAVARWGRLDLLANVAGVLWFERDRSLADIDLEVWNRVLQINLGGVMLTSRLAIPHMVKQGGGAMVHFSTVQCLRGDTKPQDAYQASKAGVVALSKSIAIQFAAKGIRSNTILPGATYTPMQARWSTEEIRKKVAEHVPLGRIASPDDMSNACLFLLSDKASYITGTELIVDGGVTARP